MPDATYQPGVYRSSGGDQFEVVSSGRILIDSGGEIDIISGGRLEIAGTALITSGGKVDLSSTANFVNANIHSTGTVRADTSLASTGTCSVAGGFTSTGASFTSTGSGTAAKFDAVTSTGTGTFAAVSSTGTGTFNAVTSTGTGTFNAVTSTGTGTFNAVTSTGTGTFNAVTSTGTGTFDQITTTGGVNRAISGGQVTALAGFIHAVETATSSYTSLQAYGLSIVKATGAGFIFTLAAPVAGFEKMIVCNNATANTAVVPSSTSLAVAIDGSFFSLQIATGLSTAPQWARLVAQNSTNWYLIGSSTDVTRSTAIA